MSFWSKIVENKIAVIAAAGTVAALGVGLFLTYQQYQQENNEEQVAQEQPKVELKPRKVFNILQQINKLKKEININNLSLEDMKKVFIMIAEYAKNKTAIITEKHKQERRKRFPKELRFARMPEYMREVSEGLMLLQNAMGQIQNEQNQIMASLGITQGVLTKYGQQLGSFMQQLMYDNSLTLEDTRAHLTLKTQYIEAHGERLVEAILEFAATLAPQQKQLVPFFLNAFLFDEVFEHQPNLDKEEFDVVVEKYKNSLGPEIVRLEEVLMPIIGRLQTVVGGGYGGPGGNEGMDPMGFNEQQMQAQLEAIRQQNPQAYEQIMAMMQAQGQMGR